MSLCNITGLLRDSGDNLLAGELWVQLDQAIVDTDTTPDSSILPRLFKFAIAAGNVNISLRESETHQVTYHFRFFASSGSPAVLDSDPSIDFHAFVPNLASCEFSDLLPTSIVADLRDTAIARLARLLTTNQQFAAALRGGPRYLGDYNAATYYQLDDCVSYGGSAWIWISQTPGVNSTPSPLNPNWMQGGAKGDPGGTGGQDTAYDPTGWDGALWAPSANAIRDVIVTLATTAQLAGRTTPADVETQITNRFANAALTGNPTAPSQDPNVALATNGGRVANMTAVKGSIHRYSRVADVKTTGTNAGNAVSGINTRELTTIVTNAGDVTNLASNTFTLRPGTYRISAIAQAFRTDVHRAFLWNVTAGSRTLIGTTGVTYATDSVLSPSFIRGVFTIASNTDFQIRHWCQTAATNGLGFAANEGGSSEQYTQVEIWRVD